MKQFLNLVAARAARRGSRDILVAATLASVLLLSAAAPASATARQRSEPPVREAVPPKGPLLLIVSTDRQRISVWSPDGKVTESPVSTGRSGFETPHGIFSVLGKEVEHFSNLYDDAPMPYMQRLTWSGVALHAGRLPGYPASHGCVRLGHAFSKSLFGMTQVGTRVLVVDEDVAPRSIAHPRLFTPLPPEPPAVAAEAEKPTEIIASIGTLEPAGNPPPLPEEATATGHVRSGVAVASARDEALPARRSRASLAAARTAEMTGATQRLASTEARVKELAPAAKSAGVAAFEAVKAQRVARIAADRTAEEMRRLESRIAAAREDVEFLAKKRERLAENGSNAAMDRTAEQEAAIEARLAQLADELARVRANEAETRAALDRATAETQRRDIDKAAAAGALKGAMEAHALAKTTLEKLQREAASQARPITVLVSRKTGKLHVRQGFNELFETDVTIDNREQPLGLHLFTASAKPGAGDELRWSVVTLQGGREAPLPRRKSRRGIVETAEPAKFEPTTASRALDRITIPPEALERIAEHVKPGSSLIIADEAPSRETGKGTDFVMLTR